jgi:hypothetical protein
MSISPNSPVFYAQKLRAKDKTMRLLGLFQQAAWFVEKQDLYLVSQQTPLRNLSKRNAPQPDLTGSPPSHSRRAWANSLFRITPYRCLRNKGTVRPVPLFKGLVSLAQDGISRSCPSRCVRQLLCRDWARGRGYERDILEEESPDQRDQRKDQDRHKAVLKRSS